MVGDDDILCGHLTGVADIQLEGGRLADLNLRRRCFFEGDDRLLRTLELPLARRRRRASGGCV
jgi:hypothetical protein